MYLRRDWTIELRKHNKTDYEVVDTIVVTEYRSCNALIDAQGILEKKHNLCVVDAGMMVGEDNTSRDMYVEQGDEEIYYSLEIVKEEENTEVEEGVFLFFDNKDKIRANEEIYALYKKIYLSPIDNPISMDDVKKMEELIKSEFNCTKIVY